MKKLLEIGKDVLLVLLTLAVIVLTVLALPARTVQQTPWLAAMLKPFASVLGMSEAELTYTQAAEPVLNAAQPLTITVKNSAGRCSYQYDFTALDSAYETLGGALGQALDTAGPAQSSTYAKLYAAMQQKGVLFCYPAEIPAAVLAAWLDAQPDADAPAADMCLLSVQDGAVRLYLAGEECWVCETKLPADTLEQMLESCKPDGSFLASEDATGRFKLLAPDTLLTAEAVSVPGVTAANPVSTQLTTSLAGTLGFNPYGGASYTDSGGTTRFTEGASTLSVSAAGLLSLYNGQRTDARFNAASDSPSDLIEAARTLLAGLTADTLGDARLYLRSFSQSDGGAVCSFDYVVSGILVTRTDGPAATVRFDGAQIAEATLNLRTYRLTSAQTRLLPAAQAAAILPEGSGIVVQYADTGGQTLEAGWKTRQ